VVDLDGDGDTDVVASLANGALTVFWQTSPLTFERAEIAVNGTAWVQPYDVGDMDGDGDLDVVIFAQLSSGFFRLRVVRQTSPGVFGPVSSAIGGNIPQVFDARVADMDGDGDLDVLMATRNASQGPDFGTDWLAVFWQTQAGVFAATPTHIGTYPDVDDPSFVHAADLDRDGQLDVVTTNPYTNEILIYRQVGEHKFASPLRLGGTGILDRPYFLRVSDLDADGDLDVIVHNSGSAQTKATLPRLKVFLQQQDGVFDPAPRAIDERIESFYDVADYDGDGQLDILGRDNENDDDSVIDVFRRPQFGDADSEPIVLGNQTQGLLAGVRAVDMDSDGDQDLLTPGPRVRWQVRPREFSPTPTALMTPAELLMPLVGDLDGDGDLDLIGMQFSSVPDEQGDLEILWQVRQGAFESSTLFQGSNRTSITTLGPLADVDGDGDVDVLATIVEVGVESPGRPVAFDQVRLGEFELDFQPFGDLSQFEVIDVAFVEDIDQDGRLDLVCRTPASRIVLWGAKSGGFEPAPTTLPTFGVGSFVDLDGDGDLDIVGRGQNDARVYWQVAYREFGSTPSTFFMLNCGSGNGARVQTVDFDGDGDLELVTGSCGTIQVHRQLGAGRFDVQPLIDGTPESFLSFPQNPHAADLDGDGDFELLGEQSNFTMKIYWGPR
jgi:hypothetical protein